MKYTAVIALLLASMLAGCGQEQTQSPNQNAADPASMKNNTLLVVSPHNQQIRDAFSKAFSDYHQQRHGAPVQVEWLDQGGTGAMMQYIRSEFTRSPEGINLDVLFGGGTEPYLELASQGRFEKHQPPEEILVALPKTYGGIPLYAEDYAWFGAALSGFGIIYNKPLLEKQGLPTPTVWENLADPKLYSWVGSADPRQSGSVHMTYEIVLQAYGWEKGWDVITRLGGNLRRFAGSGGDVPKDVAAGDVACGMAIDLYAWQQVAETGADRLAFFMPEGLTVINPDGIGIFKGAPHKEAAGRFIDFVLSEEGQKLWMLKAGDPDLPGDQPLYRMSVLPSLYEELGDRQQMDVNPFAAKSSLNFDVEKSRARYIILNDLLGALVVDTHKDLQRAWKTVVDAGIPPDALAELSRVPITEEEALNLAASQASDDAARNSRIAGWVKFAREKYAKAEELCRK